jgi:hypothetical protein
MPRTMQRSPRSTQSTPPRAFQRRGLSSALAAVMAVLACGAQAQTSACDDFKATLAARIESTGVRGYSLETVPASTAVPSGAKVIGTCESGAFKILYRRWGAARAPSGAASEARVASSPQGSAVPEAQSRRAPITQVVRNSPPPTASAPVVVPLPVARSKETASAPAVVPPEPVKLPSGSASDVVAVRAADRPASVPAVDSMVAPDPAIPLMRRTADFLSGQWAWFAALGLVALLGVRWLWRTYLSPYDRDGLPRGPRL